MVAAGAPNGSVGAVAADRYHTAFEAFVAKAREPVLPNDMGVPVA